MIKKTPVFITFPWAFITPGGGEMQILKYKEYLNKTGIHAKMFNLWLPQIKPSKNIIHFFSCMGGSSHTCRFFKKKKFPLVVTSSLWITEDTKSNYGIDEIRDQCSLADFVITNSIIESKQLSKILEIDIKKFRVVYNGFDDHHLKLRKEYMRRTTSSKTNITCNAKNEPRKQQ